MKKIKINVSFFMFFFTTSTLFICCQNSASQKLVDSPKISTPDAMSPSAAP